MSNLISVAKKVLEEEADAVLQLTSSIDDEFVQAAEMIASMKGRLITMGMGKSGHIATKIAATFASTGTPAFFVHPGEASHGDLGMIKKGDVVILFSYSGEAIEICQIIPALKHIGALLISVTGNPGSTMASLSSLSLLVRVKREACPLGLAPTTSTTATLALGDALAVCVLNLRGFTKEDFARSHPAGLLGRRLILNVSDLMHKRDELPTVLIGASMKEAILEMTRRQEGVVVVLDNKDQVRGIFTDGDLRRMLNAQVDLENTKVEQYMSENPITIKADILAIEALQVMERKEINCCLVSDNEGFLAGLITMRDIKTSGIT